MAGVLDTVRDLDRLRQIVTVLVRHGFGEVVKRTGLSSLMGGKVTPSERPATTLSFAARLRLVLQDLGPSFVKLGQILSTRPDLIPMDVIIELRKLLDDVPPVPFDQLRAEVEQALGTSIEELYVDFEPVPVASASIGQVHRAKLKRPDGLFDVAVKIQRPKIRSTIERDMDLLYWLARAVERAIPESRVHSPTKLVAEFDRTITAELDFQREADHAERFARNFAGDPDVKFPGVYREASGKTVLTLEWLEGKKVLEAVAEGANGDVIAKKAVAGLVRQLFEHGFFHADPHPGNVLILGPNDNPVIGLVDLGMVGRLTPHLRDRTIDLMVATVREDYRGIADALYALGHPIGKVDRKSFEAEVTVLAEKHMGKKLGDIDLAALLRDLSYGANKYGIEIPADFLMVGKTVMTLDGVGKQISPHLDFYEEIKPHLLKLFYQRYSPENVTEEMMRGLVRLSGAAGELPGQLQEILDDLRKGTLGVQVTETNMQRSVERLGRHIFNGLLAMGLVLGIAVLFSTGHGSDAWILVGIAAVAWLLSWASSPKKG